MKSVEFNEDQLGDLSAVAAELFGDSDDPRSFAYKRVNVRPEIKWHKIILICLGTAAALCGIYFLVRISGVSPLISAGIALACFSVFICVNAKKTVICLIQIYQRYAPDSIRNKCRFEPSCSQYMILAIQKYGFFKGIKKGINRLKRCNINGGGFDYP